MYGVSCFLLFWWTCVLVVLIVVSLLARCYYFTLLWIASVVWIECWLGCLQCEFILLLFCSLGCDLCCLWNFAELFRCVLSFWWGLGLIRLVVCLCLFVLISDVLFVFWVDALVSLFYVVGVFWFNCWGCFR